MCPSEPKAGTTSTAETRALPRAILAGPASRTTEHISAPRLPSSGLPLAATCGQKPADKGRVPFAESQFWCHKVEGRG